METTPGMADDRRFECEQCAFKSKRKSKLKEHVKCVHEKLKLFKCPQCGHTFGRRDILDKHLQATHDNIKPYKCQLCSHEATQRSRFG